MTVVHRVVVPLAFPAGVRPGAGKGGGNRLLLAVDGLGRPLLRGSALAGALRHAYARELGVRSRDDQVCRWFGSPCDGERGFGRGEPSPLRVSDVVLGDAKTQPVLRHHISVDRHTGTVREGGLFEIEVLPPGTRGQSVLELHDDEEQATEAMRFLRTLVGLLAEGMVLGGSGARGVGRVQVSGPVLLCRCDLATVGGHAAFLDERYALRKGQWPSTGDVLQPILPRDHILRVELVLGVPRGQDLLVGDGQGLDHEIEPQRVVDAQGRAHWRLPGSALRGVLRAWVARLARREGKPVADSLEAHRQHGPAKGEDLAWGWDGDEIRKSKVERLGRDPLSLQELVPCPVMRLFGSAYSRGRVHVTDGLAPRDPGGEQVRAHVAVDRITGGANEGFLFENQVICGAKGGRQRARFRVVLTVDRPAADETRWLVAAVRALDRGILRVGSSKAGGRLALAEPPVASGPQAAAFSELKPSEADNV